MPETHHLSFCIMSKLPEHCTEIVVNKGVEVSLDILIAYHDWLLSNLQPSMYILLNKIFFYTYSFEEQMQLASLQRVNAMAIVTYDKVYQSTTQIMQTVPRERDWTIELFDDREAALSFLNRLNEEYKTKLQISQTTQVVS